MKRIITLVLSLLLLVSLVGCGNDSGSKTVSETAFKNLEIKEFKWYVSNGYLKYLIVLHNPNDDYMVEYPGYRITAKDSNDVLLGTEDQTLSKIYPGQDFIYGSQAFSVEETPSKVDIEVLPIEDYNIKRISQKDEFIPLEVINTAERKDGFMTKFVGEINNKNNYDIDSAVLICVCKDEKGDLVAVDFEFIDNLKAAGNSPFEMTYMGEDGYSSVEYYANIWD